MTPREDAPLRIMQLGDMFPLSTSLASWTAFIERTRSCGIFLPNAVRAAALLPLTPSWVHSAGTGSAGAERSPFQSLGVSLRKSPVL